MIGRVRTVISRYLEAAYIDVIFIISECNLSIKRAIPLLSVLCLTYSSLNAYDRKVTVSFIVVLHSIWNSKGKGIQEMSGSVNWNRLFKTVISISPSDLGDDYRILKIEKDRSVSKRNNIIIKRIELPYLHFEYSLEEYETISSEEIEVKMPEYIDNIPTKVVEEMYC